MNVATKSSPTNRWCILAPIPEISVAAQYLNAAVDAHLNRDHALAEELIRAADIPAIREWTEYLWGQSHVISKSSAPSMPREQRVRARMPRGQELNRIHSRDGYHCRFCRIPVVRKEVRNHLRSFYPDAIPWGTTNRDQHAGLQAMWVQYDHVLPHARGGDNSFENIVVACAPCNCARMSSTVEEVGLLDPRMREPYQSDWDGLERALKKSTSRSRVV